MSALVVVLVLLAAQVHPCDPVAEQLEGQVFEGAAMFATFCQAATENIEAVTIYRADGVAMFLSVLEVVSAPNAAGLVQYRVSLGQAPTRGIYTYRSATWNRDAQGTPQEGPQGNPFVLSVVAVPGPVVPAPTVPVNFRIGS